MRFLLEYKFVLSFAAVLTICSFMVVRQAQLKQMQRVELREAFILLHTRGYKEEARRLYNRLLRDMDQCSNKDLFDDFQRTLILVDPTTQHPENLIWSYHWTVSNELDRRAERTLQRAHEIAAKK